MINFRIDELLPCLKEVESGEIYETEVIRIKRKSVLAKFNENTGWYVKWNEFPVETEIYALVLKGTNDIQGMLAIDYDDSAKAVYVRWGCTAPHNNKWKYGRQKYLGVGGHLLAVASELSVRRGYDGFIYAEAMDKELYCYFCDKFKAYPLPSINNPYRFMLSDEATREIREVYNYEWTDEII